MQTAGVFRRAAVHAIDDNIDPVELASPLLSFGHFQGSRLDAGDFVWIIQAFVHFLTTKRSEHRCNFAVGRREEIEKQVTLC